MLGRSEEAQSVYIEAIQASRGDPGATGTWTKCYASLGKWTTAQLADMQAAATFLAGVHVHTSLSLPVCSATLYKALEMPLFLSPVKFF